MRGLFFVMAFVLCSIPAFAEAPTYYRPKPIEVKKAYTLTAPSWMSARPAYMQIVNNADEDDVLMGAETPFADEVILQYTHDYGFGIQTMRPLENQELQIPAQSIVHLKPGGIHLLLHDLKQPLELGYEVPIKLIFKNSPDIYVKAIIHQQPDEPVEIDTK